MNVGFWASTCMDCQKTKVARHVRPPVRHIDVPSRRFSHIHIDLVGPLPAVPGYTHVFTVMYCSTRWPAVYSNRDSSAEPCIAALAEWNLKFWGPCQADL